jgi:superfamily I DNA/RNA helicase
MPKLRLLRCVGAELAAESARIVQITEDQRAILQGLLASDRVLVEGTAGSGKTLLALDFAVSMASEGQSVLFLCFNRQLSTWLQEQVKAEPRLRGREVALEISNFHSFAMALARRAGVEISDPEVDSQHFWDEDVPMALEQALDLLRERGSATVFDAVVVDEAQDFARDWWVTVESLTRGGQRGRLYVFLDLHQSLRGEGRLPPVSLPTKFRLNTNCRNTQSIARSAGRFAGVEIRLLPGSPEGEMPALRRAPSASATAGLVLQEVRNLLRSGVSPRQMALIGAAAYQNGSLARFHEVDGIPLISDAAAWRRGEGLLVTTARAFKGLEADVALVYDVAAFSPGFSRTDLYVAWTRARNRLLVFSHGTDVREAVEEALAQSEAVDHAEPPHGDAIHFS